MEPIISNKLHCRHLNKRKTRENSGTTALAMNNKYVSLEAREPS
jgi:hypothetical protein